MSGRFLIFLMLGVAVLAGWGIINGTGSRAAEDDQTAVDDAYKKATEARREADTTEEKLAIIKAFLGDYPESKHTAQAVRIVVYYQGENLGDMEGAISYVEGIRDVIRDPDIARQVDKRMVESYGEAGMIKKMVSVADRLGTAGELDFSDHWNVIESAVRAEEWALVRDYCRRAMGMASAEAYRADYPDDEFTDEEVDAAAKNRLGMLLVKNGWARANQGQLYDALADFARADDLVRRSYFDVPEYDLDLYWGKTLMMTGEHEAAMEKFAADGLIMRNEEALAGLKEAYVAVHGEESGFQAYASKLHRDIAKTVEDFDLLDYEGDRRRFSDLKGDVTLLAFWFPT